MDVKIIVATRIKMARAERGINQSQLGDLVGVGQATITKWESGNVSIGIDTVQRIAEALKKPLTYFFTELDGESIPKAERRAASPKKKAA